MSGAKTHWRVTYVMTNGYRLQETTRGQMEPATREEMVEALPGVLVEAVRQRGGLLTVRDILRGGESSIIFTSALSHLELERDVPENWVESEAEAQRHLELVLTDPATFRQEREGHWDPEPQGNYGPGQPRPRDPEPGAPGFRMAIPPIPAGPDRHA